MKNGPFEEAFQVYWAFHCYVDIDIYLRPMYLYVNLCQSIDPVIVCFLRAERFPSVLCVEIAWVKCDFGPWIQYVLYVKPWYACVLEKKK